LRESSGIIIDTDPGIDDAIAILMALAATSNKVLGLTTVGGNVPLARGTRNALAVLNAAGRADVPVHRGSSRPVSGRFGYSFAFHGNTGLPSRLPKPKAGPAAQRATDFLAQSLRASPGEVNLVALGPLTNLARLMQRHPGALELAGSVAIMGGAVNTPGNVTPHAEFNFFSDPVAADMVMSSTIPVTLVDLGASRQAALNHKQVETLRGGNALGQLAIRLLQDWFRLDSGRKQFQFYDPLALAAAIDPQVVSGRPMTLRVVTIDQQRLGESLTVRMGGNIVVAERVDSARFFALLKRLFDWDGIDPEKPL
jgi:purine nucleosidase